MPNFLIVWMKNEKMRDQKAERLSKKLTGRRKSHFCSVLQWLQKNGESDRFENFFAFAEHVPLWTEPPYWAIKISNFEKKIRKHEFFEKNFLEFSEKLKFF